MRYQGQITNWKDEQGFGFISPNDGGQQVFVHVKSFSTRHRRPAGNESVTYELETDARGRARAERVAFVGESVPSTHSAGQGNIALIFTLAFLAFVGGSVFVGKAPIAVFWLYLLASAIAFVAYALDKSAARSDRWRMQESTLHLFALAGGWPGALVAQKLLRHKSRKRSFQIMFWGTVALNCGALGWLFSPAGAQLLRFIRSVA